MFLLKDFLYQNQSDTITSLKKEVHVSFSSFSLWRKALSGHLKRPFQILRGPLKHPTWNRQEEEPCENHYNSKLLQRHSSNWVLVPGTVCCDSVASWDATWASLWAAVRVTPRSNVPHDLASGCWSCLDSTLMPQAVATLSRSTHAKTN